MSIIIGIGHRSSHGKDTVARYMKSYFNAMTNYDVVICSWAKKLKEICHELYKQYGMRDQAFYDTDEGRAFRNIPLPVIGKTPVEIWIDMGEGIRDRVYENTWRDFVRDNIKADIVICPDTRKPTELDICDIKIKVENPRIANRVGKSIDQELADYNGWHHYLINNGNLGHLERKVNNLCFNLLPTIEQLHKYKRTILPA